MPKDKHWSTEEAAEKAGISRATIMRWLAKGRVSASINVQLNDQAVLHRWTEDDITRLKSAVKEHYGAGRTGRPPTRAR
jgi:DNA-binding transcriptional regulator LsrR (DeoR family)